MENYPVKITLKFTKDDVEALKQKFYLDPDVFDIEECLTNCIWEMINTYVEM